MKLGELRQGIIAAHSTTQPEHYGCIAVYQRSQGFACEGMKSACRLVNTFHFQVKLVCWFEMKLGELGQGIIATHSTTQPEHYGGIAVYQPLTGVCVPRDEVGVPFSQHIPFPSKTGMLV